MEINKQYSSLYKSHCLYLIEVLISIAKFPECNFLSCSVNEIIEFVLKLVCYVFFPRVRSRLSKEKWFYVVETSRDFRISKTIREFERLLKQAREWIVLGTKERFTSKKGDKGEYRLKSDMNKVRVIRGYSCICTDICIQGERH